MFLNVPADHVPEPELGLRDACQASLNFTMLPLARTIRLVTIQYIHDVAVLDQLTSARCIAYLLERVLRPDAVHQILKLLPFLQSLA